MPRQEPLTEDGLQLGREDHGRITSAEEFANASYDEPFLYERVHGRLVVMSPEGTGHISQSEPWRNKLGTYSERPENAQPVAVVSQAWIRIDGDNTRIADIAIYLNANYSELTVPDQVPDLVFEVVSPSKADRRRDYVEKRADYQKVGVREYVIVDRFRQQVTVLTLGPDGYAERVLTLDETYRSPLLPGFEVRLAEVSPR